MLKLITNLRWKLTLWFLLLAMVVFITSALFGSWIFKTAMMNFVDRELEVLTNELIPAIDIVNKEPSLKQWREKALEGPYRAIPIIQLFNKEGQLIESYGPRGIPVLFSRIRRARADIQEDTYHIRVHSVPLDDGHNLIGYLQLQLSLKNVDGAMTNFVITMAIIAPFLLIGYGAAGYFFSKKAAQPVEEAFTALQRFMADAGHELGTPLSIVLANTESIEADLPTESSIKVRLETIARSTERMNKLVRDMMLLAKLEGSPELAKTRVIDLKDILQESIIDFGELYRGKNVGLTEEQFQSAMINADADAIKRVISNLLQNALKYTDSGGKVSLSLQVAGKLAKITIADTGIGIPGENLSKIFDRFYRVDESRSRAAGGSGLGLSIVKAIIEAHKGKIEVTSTKGAGTTFSILLPTK